MNSILRGRQGDPVTLLASLERQGGREVGFAGARWAEEADVRLLLDPGELREMLGERALRARLCCPVEVLERLQGGEAGVADAPALRSTNRASQLHAAF